MKMPTSQSINLVNCLVVGCGHFYAKQGVDPEAVSFDFNYLSTSWLLDIPHGFAIPKPHGCEVKPKCPFLEFGFLGLKAQLRIQLGFLTVNTVSAIVRMHKDILVVTFTVSFIMFIIILSWCLDVFEKLPRDSNNKEMLKVAI
ncbi:hypothetical protein MRB53_014710 [Persea americana]|uniref:Uncharacterized protein n=1 Tax=Persea americana TaxID=3435 RepID=A0ACC2KC41_PERAE|nr:hypothetical protein MRB53_014710 [Persea americana]